MSCSTRSNKPPPTLEAYQLTAKRPHTTLRPPATPSPLHPPPSNTRPHLGARIHTPTPSLARCRVRRPVPGGTAAGRAGALPGRDEAARSQGAPPLHRPAPPRLRPRLRAPAQARGAGAAGRAGLLRASLRRPCCVFGRACAGRGCAAMAVARHHPSGALSCAIPLHSTPLHTTFHHTTLHCTPPRTTPHHYTPHHTPPHHTPLHSTHQVSVMDFFRGHLDCGVTQHSMHLRRADGQGRVCRWMCGACEATCTQLVPTRRPATAHKGTALPGAGRPAGTCSLQRAS